MSYAHADEGIPREGRRRTSSDGVRPTPRSSSWKTSVPVENLVGCSRASIGELALLMAESQERVNANVVFVRPWEFPDEWEKTDLWSKVAAIPGVTMSVDQGGIEAQRFGSQTSGQVMVYSPQGQLLFSGGITSSRGHSGDNEGRSAIVTLLTQGRSEKRETPVYGCPLFRKALPVESEESCNASHQ